jgi:hypothetical protein
MVLLDDTIKNQIIKYIDNIINIPDNNWNMFDLKMKIKYIHHLCNLFINEDILAGKKNQLTIPLKSIKPKKLIHYCNFTKSINSNLFKEYCQKILVYTFEFRSKYVKITKRIYFNYKNLPLIEYNTILNEYNQIIYLFLKENFNNINITNLFNNLTDSNSDKLFNCGDKNISINLDIICEKNILTLKFSNNINITLKLIYSSDMITNNIPVVYQIVLTNYI